MKSSIFKMAAEFLREKKNRRYWLSVLTCLALVVAVGTVAALKLTGQAKTYEVRVLNCALAVHQHTRDCYDREDNLVCGQADYAVHIHNDDCRDEDTGRLACRLPVVEIHTHDVDCYALKEVLICEVEETEAHMHTEDCYAQENALLCGLEEAEGHIHTGDCYDQETSLTCSLPEIVGHIHSDDCYEQVTELTCPWDEGEDHTHEDGCYTTSENLVCSLEETEGHTHTDECFDTREVLTCALDEAEGHIHTDDCYGPEGEPVLTCWLEEAEEGHIHTDECYEIQEYLTCEEEEVELHTHDNDCYEEVWYEDEDGEPYSEMVLTCPLLQVEEHVHTIDCFDIYEIATDEADEFFGTLNGENEDPKPEVELTDIEGYSLSVGVYKKAGDNWAPVQDGDWFNPGDEIMIHLDYTIPAGQLQNGEVITYQLPPVVHLKEDLILDVTNEKGDVVGKATVSPDGKVTIELDDNIDTTIGLSGTLEIQGWIREDIEADGGSHQFPGTGSTIVVGEKDPDGGDSTDGHDVWVNKETTDIQDDPNNPGKKIITYKVKVGSTKGTGSDITFKDYFVTEPKDGQPQPDFGDITVTKKSGESTETVTDHSLTAENGAINGTLPALDEGEEYEITYTVTVDPEDYENTPDGLLSLTNRAEADIDNDGHNQDDSTTTLQGSQVSKSGKYEDGTFTWTIWVAEGNSGKKLWDIPGKELQELIEKLSDYTGDDVGADIPVTVTCTDGETHNVTLKDLLNGYEITCDAEHTFTFETPSGLGIGEGATYNNNAQLGGSEPGDGGYNVGSGDIQGGYDGWSGVKDDVDRKDVAGPDGRTAQEQLLWSMTINFPDGDWSEATFTDTFRQTIRGRFDPDNMEHWEERDLHHYQTLGQLKSELETSLETGLSNADLSDDVSYTIVYRDKDGNEIPDTELDAEVTSFEIIFTNETGRNLYGHSLSFSYTSLADTEGFLDGTNYNIDNDFTLPDVTGEAGFWFEYTDHVDEDLEKLAYNPSSGQFEFDSLDFGYELGKDNEIKYRITYKFPTNFKYSSNNITITDAISPADLVGVNESDVYVKYWIYNNDGTYRAQEWVNEVAPDGQNGIGHSPTRGNYDGGDDLVTISDGIMTVTIPKIYYEFIGNAKANGYLQDVAGFVIEYSVKLSDEAIKDLLARGASITNTAKVGRETASHETTLHEKAVQKDGNVVTDAEGNPTNTVNYFLDVNPDAKDLVPDSDWIEVSDTITVTNSAGEDIHVKVYPDLDSMKVYKYVNGQKVLAAPSEYKFSFTDESKSGNTKYHLELKLKDSTHYEVEYSYTVDPTGPDGTIYKGAQLSNTASLCGESSTESGKQLSQATGSASVTQGQFPVYKTEKGNQSVKLPGAEFDVYVWNNDTQEWVFYTHAITLKQNLDENFQPLGDDANERDIKYKKGQILFSKNPNADSANNDWVVQLQENVVYALVETDAPDGYRETGEVTYVCYRVPVTITDETGTMTDLYKTDQAFWESIQDTISQAEVPGTGGSRLDSQDKLQFNPQFVTIDNPTYDREPPVIEKVDEKDSGKTLPGATFDVYVWENGESDEEAGQWMLKGSATTNSDGQIKFNAEKAWGNRETYEIPLFEGAIYALVETEAPNGYQLDNTPHFYCYPYSRNSDGKPTNVTDLLATATGIQEATVGSTGMSINNTTDLDGKAKIFNEPAKGEITVNKVWKDLNGDVMEDAPENSVQVVLKRYAYQGGIYLTTQPADAENWCQFTLKYPYSENYSDNGKMWAQMLGGDGKANELTVWIPKNAQVQLSTNCWYQGSAEFQNAEGVKTSFDVPDSSWNYTFDVGDADSYELTILSAKNFNNVYLNIVGDAPDGFVPSGNSETIDSVVLSDSNGWSHTWSDLPLNDGNGTQYVYTVEEENPPAGYAPTVTDNSDGSFTVTNQKALKRGEIVVEKVWLDADGELVANPPEYVEVELQRKAPSTVYLTKTNGQWVADGYASDDLCDFTIVISGKSAGKDDIDGSIYYDNGTGNIYSTNLAWDSDKDGNASVTLRVPKNSTYVLKIKDWGEFPTLEPQITPSVEGPNWPDGSWYYERTYEFNVGNGGTLTISGGHYNMLAGTYLVAPTSGDGNWVTVGTKRLNVGNNWKTSWTDLPDGEYRVVEKTVDGYRTSYSYTYYDSEGNQLSGDGCIPGNTGTATVTNRAKVADDDEIIVEKVWQYPDGTPIEGHPEKATVCLYWRKPEAATIYAGNGLAMYAAQQEAFRTTAPDDSEKNDWCEVTLTETNWITAPSINSSGNPITIWVLKNSIIRVHLYFFYNGNATFSPASLSGDSYDHGPNDNEEKVFDFAVGDTSAYSITIAGSYNTGDVEVLVNGGGEVTPDPNPSPDTPDPDPSSSPDTPDPKPSSSPDTPDFKEPGTIWEPYPDSPQRYLSAENGWRVSWTGLPVGYEYRVMEPTVTGYLTYYTYTDAEGNFHEKESTPPESVMPGTVVTVTNVKDDTPPSPTLPSTGGMGTWLYTLTGGTLILSAGIYSLTQRRKRRNASN